MKEFEDILDNDADPTNVAYMAGAAEAGNVELAHRTVVVLVAKSAAQYWVRDLRVCQSSPARILWFPFRHPELECPDRKRMAADLLDLPLPWLGNASFKIRIMLMPDVIHSAETGKCTPRVYRLMCAVREVWHADVQEVEGLNNVIKSITNRVPPIELPFVASRFSNGKAVHSQSGRSQRENVLSILDHASEHHNSMAYNWLDEQPRFMPVSWGSSVMPPLRNFVDELPALVEASDDEGEALDEPLAVPPAPAVLPAPLSMPPPPPPPPAAAPTGVPPVEPAGLVGVADVPAGIMSNAPSRLQ